jgi:hypothetical protein
LVNDMKTIMNDQEFREMVGHLAAVLKIRPKKLRKNWHCRRGFAIEEPPTKEPPLPDTTPGWTDRVASADRRHARLAPAGIRACHEEAWGNSGTREEAQGEERH